MTLSFDESTVREKIKKIQPDGNLQSPLNIHTDTTEFYEINYGDIVAIGDEIFLIGQNAKEGRFGLDDEVKFWVKKATDLNSGEKRVLKLTFYERFTSNIGGITFENFRSPRKEARILELVTEHPNFMHGYPLIDDAGNIVRVLEFIHGRGLPSIIDSNRDDHETFFHTLFPEIYDNFIECVRAIKFLHDQGEKHGDIRRDHIFIDRKSNRYRWIDFDYNYKHRENIFGFDLFGLGSILTYIAGKGDVTTLDLYQCNDPALERLSQDDLNIVWSNRVSNLKKMYPYIPEKLNRILMQFSKSAHYYYETSDQLLDDLLAARSDIKPT